MDIAPLSVTHTLTLELIDASGTATPLEAELRYDNHDPYAVSACFDT
ncbi:MAG: SsgA family sporulation/cell division regulator, partial [Nocardioidaceae bacterium]|nr:SsgA family sporulation/cell division regulator [Nocardioidaceae bacterium]